VADTACQPALTLLRLSALVNLQTQPLKGIFPPSHQNFTVQFPFFCTHQPLCLKLHINYQAASPTCHPLLLPPPSFPHLPPPSPIFPHIGGGAPGSEAASPPLAAASAHQSRGACGPAPSVGGATGAAAMRRRSTGLTSPPPEVAASMDPTRLDLHIPSASLELSLRRAAREGRRRRREGRETTAAREGRRRRRRATFKRRWRLPSSARAPPPLSLVRRLPPPSLCGGSRLTPSGYGAKDVTPEAPEQGRGAVAAGDPAGRAVRKAAASSTASSASSPRLPPLSLSPTAGHTGRLSAPSDVACVVRPPNAPGMEAAGPNGMVPSPFQVAGAGGKGEKRPPGRSPPRCGQFHLCPLYTDTRRQRVSDTPASSRSPMAAARMRTTRPVPLRVVSHSVVYPRSSQSRPSPRRESSPCLPPLPLLFAWNMLVQQLIGIGYDVKF
jgi:hypothetical protein